MLWWRRKFTFRAQILSSTELGGRRYSCGRCVLVYVQTCHPLLILKHNSTKTLPGRYARDRRAAATQSRRAYRYTCGRPVNQTNHNLKINQVIKSVNQPKLPTIDQSNHKSSNQACNQSASIHQTHMTPPLARSLAPHRSRSTRESRPPPPLRAPLSATGSILIPVIQIQIQNRYVQAWSVAVERHCHVLTREEIHG